MTVGLKLGSMTGEIGGQDFFHSFFSTVSYRLESSGWGSRFPCLLKKLYLGRLKKEDAVQALEELEVITRELREFGPDQVVWDIEDLDAVPPWGSNISSEITDLSNYFVTSTGRDLIGVMKEFIELLQRRGEEILVVNY